MNEARLNNVCDEMQKRLEMGKALDEEQVDIFQEEIMSMLAEEKLQEEPCLSCYRGLEQTICEMYQYGMTDEMGDADNIFLLGAVWSAITLYRKKEEREKEKRAVKALALNCVDYKWFLDTINANPGITYQELAQKGNMTSPFIYQMEKEHLYIYLYFGDEKYYYLTQRGQDVRKKMWDRNSITVSVLQEETIRNGSMDFNFLRAIVGKKKFLGRAQNRIPAYYVPEYRTGLFPFSQAIEGVVPSNHFSKGEIEKCIKRTNNSNNGSTDLRRSFKGVLSKR